MAEKSTDDEKTVEKLAEKRKWLWARRDKAGEETGGRERTWSGRERGIVGGVERDEE